LLLSDINAETAEKVHENVLSFFYGKKKQADSRISVYSSCFVLGLSDKRIFQHID
jgi:hypothetical protein